MNKPVTHTTGTLQTPTSYSIGHNTDARGRRTNNQVQRAYANETKSPTLTTRSMTIRPIRWTRFGRNVSVSGDEIIVDTSAPPREFPVHCISGNHCRRRNSGILRLGGDQFCDGGGRRPDLRSKTIRKKGDNASLRGRYQQRSSAAGRNLNPVARSVNRKNVKSEGRRSSFHPTCF